jgi:hypothetical protein
MINNGKNSTCFPKTMSNTERKRQLFPSKSPPHPPSAPPAFLFHATRPFPAFSATIPALRNFA